MTDHPQPAARMTERPYSPWRVFGGALLGVMLGLVLLVVASLAAIPLLGGSDGAGIAAIAILSYGMPGAVAGGALLGGWLLGRPRNAGLAPRPVRARLRQLLGGGVGAIAGFVWMTTVDRTWRVLSGGGSVQGDLILLLYGYPALIIFGAIIGVRAGSKPARIDPPAS